MADPQKAYRLLGMANRARRITLGNSATLKSLSKGQTQLLILAVDISANSKSKIELAAEKNRVEIIISGTKDELGRLFGRTELGIIGVDDIGFANSLKKIFRC